MPFCRLSVFLSVFLSAFFSFLLCFPFCVSLYSFVAYIFVVCILGFFTLSILLFHIFHPEQLSTSILFTIIKTVYISQITMDHEYAIVQCLVYKTDERVLGFKFRRPERRLTILGHGAKSLHNDNNDFPCRCEDQTQERELALILPRLRKINSLSLYSCWRSAMRNLLRPFPIS